MRKNRTCHGWLTNILPMEQVLKKKRKKRHRHLKLSLVIVEIGPIRSQTTRSIQPRPGRPLMRLLLSQCANIANFVLSTVHFPWLARRIPSSFPHSVQHTTLVRTVDAVLYLALPQIFPIYFSDHLGAYSWCLLRHLTENIGIQMGRTLTICE